MVKNGLGIDDILCDINSMTQWFDLRPSYCQCVWRIPPLKGRKDCDNVTGTTAAVGIVVAIKEVMVDRKGRVGTVTSESQSLFCRTEMFSS